MGKPDTLFILYGACTAKSSQSSMEFPNESSHLVKNMPKNPRSLYGAYTKSPRQLYGIPNEILGSCMEHALKNPRTPKPETRNHKAEP